MNATHEGIRDDVHFTQWSAGRSGVALAMPRDFYEHHRVDQSRMLSMAWTELAK